MKRIEVNQETENKSYGEKITKWAGIVGGSSYFSQLGGITD